MMDQYEVGTILRVKRKKEAYGKNWQTFCNSKKINPFDVYEGEVCRTNIISIHGESWVIYAFDIMVTKKELMARFA